MMAIVSPMIVERTDRGDDMFMTVLARHAQQVLDLDALAVLPGAGTRRAAAPRPADEGRTRPGAERLLNESWYFDVADAEQGVGAYVRLGAYPNLRALLVHGARSAARAARRSRWWTCTRRCPEHDLALRTERVRGRAAREAPLERYRVA